MAPQTTTGWDAPSRSALRFAEDDHARWMRHFARNIDPYGPAGHWELAGGRFTGPAPQMRVGLYVATMQGLLQYIGKVRRADAGIASRLGSHHHATSTWDALWLLPMVAGTSDVTVRASESVMIAALRPPQNRTRR